jgi:hypothetical protein
MNQGNSISVLTNLNHVLTLLQQNAAKMGFTVAGLLVSIYCIAIMLHNDTSPAGRAERWALLKTVFICAAIIAGTGAFVQLATGLGGML